MVNKTITTCSDSEIMTALDTEINQNDQAITLTIIPKDDYFQIIYLEETLGAIRKQESDWILMKAEEIDPEELAADYTMTGNG